MDIEVKDKFKNSPLRSKCWPMPPADCEELDRQTDELVQSELVEPFPPGTYPKFCSPMFLVEKKDAKVRRMVGQYSKLNKRTKPHAAYLPNMEEMVENLAKNKFKSKLDLRSGFWQVGLTERAQELTAFTVPSGRVFRWLCMPFGLQGAPGIFQEMMEILCGKVKEDLKKKYPTMRYFLAAFFDDVGLGTETESDHIRVLDSFLRIAGENQIRVKLSKCEFFKLELEYLGFRIGWNTWSPSEKKVQAILNSKIRNLTDLRSFLGAANFYRRHLKNFTYSSALLTDKLKKTVPWSWGPSEQKCFEELKERLVNAQDLAIPQREGELVMITDASDLGGGAVIFQWQPSTLSDYHTAQLRRYETHGVTQQGGLKHNYPDDFLLTPIGNWNWKLKKCRQRYEVYEREILAGILTLSSKLRLVA